MIRVIVADDEYKVCQLICQLIKWDELGMELIGTASNGIEALQMIEKEKPDLVLTDIRMPGYDGIELLKRAREFNSSMEFIIISGYSHFEYAQTAIRYGVSDYILKPIDSEVLNATLQKVRQRYLERQNQEESSRIQKEQQAVDKTRLRDMFWLDIESGFISEDIETINKKYYYHFQDGIFQTFLILADIKENIDINEPYADNVLNLLYSKAVIFLEKQVSSLCYEVGLFLKNGQITGVLNYLPERQQEIRDALINFINSLCVELAVFEYMQFHISTSMPFNTISALPECIDQADRAMGQRLFNTDNVLLEEVPANTEFNTDDLFKPFSFALRQSLDIFSKEQIADAVLVLQAAAFSYRLNGYQILQIVKDAYRLFLLSSIFQNMYHFSDRDELEASFNKKVMLCNNIERLFSFLCESCQKNLEEASIWLDKEKIRPITQAKQYIMEHYAEPVGLEEVSSQVGFSPSYFSTLFKKETGKTFLEYLTDIRIEQSKILLRESRMTVEMICKSVGFNDYKRFSKTFKKATCVSPKEYRKLYS